MSIHPVQRAYLKLIASFWSLPLSAWFSLLPSIWHGSEQNRVAVAVAAGAVFLDVASPVVQLSSSLRQVRKSRCEVGFRQEAAELWPPGTRFSVICTPTYMADKPIFGWTRNHIVWCVSNYQLAASCYTECP